MSKTVLQLKISQEYKKLVRELEKDDYNSLKTSIEKEGQHIPIVVNEENIILDGHHRYEICKELGIEPKVELKKFPNKLLEKKFVIETNLSRRHLNNFQKTELGIELQKIESELAKQRFTEHLPEKGEKGFQPISSSFELDTKGQARDKAAKRVGVKSTTYQRAKTIIEKAPEEVKDKVRKGQLSINYAYKAVKRSEDKKRRPPLPQGQFNVILADPPWKYDFNIRGSPDDHYPIMQDNEIQNMKIPTADNAVLFLWATAPKLVEAIEVLKKWGFEYKTNAVWVKDKIGTGYWFRGQHELLLVGVKGKGIGVPEEKDRHSSIISATRMQHSAKPEEVYEIVEKMLPGCKYLELFARGKSRPGWTVWGEEAEN